MSSFKVKLKGETPDVAYLDGTPRPRKKRSKVVDPGRWDEYLRRMLDDMKTRERKLAAIWSDIARKEAEKARQAGHAEGFEAGKEEGFDEGKNSVEPVAAKLEELVAEMNEQRERIIGGASRFVAQLAFEIAVKVIHDELKSDPEKILKQVEAALEKVVDKERIVIKVHPSDTVVVEGEERNWVAMVEGIGQLAVTEDPNLEPGDVVIETNSGVIDARIEAQIAHMHKVITEVMQDGA
jgi:flagellar assembly protein FliH